MLPIEWKMVPDGKVLRVTYQVKNTRSHTLYLLDQLVRTEKGAFVRTMTPAVADGDEPGTVKITVGFVMPSFTVPALVAPGARAFNPEKSLFGSCEVPWPLEAAHPFGAFNKELRQPIERAVLELGILGEEEGNWVTLPLADGKSLSAPGLRLAQKQELVRSEPLPLPPSGAPDKLPGYSDGFV